MSKCLYGEDMPNRNLTEHAHPISSSHNPAQIRSNLPSRSILSHRFTKKQRNDSINAKKSCLNRQVPYASRATTTKRESGGGPPQRPACKPGNHNKARKRRRAPPTAARAQAGPPQRS